MRIENSDGILSINGHSFKCKSYKCDLQPEFGHDMYWFKHDVRPKKITFNKDYSFDFELSNPSIDINEFINDINKQRNSLIEDYVYKMLRMIGCYSIENVDICNYLIHNNMSLTITYEDRIQKISIIDIITKEVISYFTVNQKYCNNGCNIVLSEINIL